MLSVQTVTDNYIIMVFYAFKLCYVRFSGIVDDCVSFLFYKMLQLH